MVRAFFSDHFLASAKSVSHMALPGNLRIAIVPAALAAGPNGGCVDHAMALPATTGQPAVLTALGGRKHHSDG